jgi:hypothetical protein
MNASTPDYSGAAADHTAAVSLRISCICNSLRHKSYRTCRPHILRAQTCSELYELLNFHDSLIEVQWSKSSVFDADQGIIFWLFFSQWRIYPPTRGIGTGTNELMRRPLNSNPYVGTRNLDQREPRVPAGIQIVFSIDELLTALLCRDERSDLRG